MERYFEKITKCMVGTEVKVDDESYIVVEGLRVIYAYVESHPAAIVDGACASQFTGRLYGGDFGVKVCELDEKNKKSLIRYFKDKVPSVYGCYT